MATTDEGVANLQRFIANLVTASGALEKAGEHLESTTAGLAELEGQVAEQGGSLGDELQRSGASLDAAEERVTQAIEAVAQAATERQGTLDAAGEELERSGGAFDERAQAVASQLDAHDRQLGEAFEALGRSVDESRQELERAQQESDQALTELEGGVRGFEADAPKAWDVAEDGLEHATSELSDHEATLAAEAAHAVEAFEAAASDTDSACSALEQDFASIYDGCASAAACDGDELAQAAQALAREGVAFVSAEQQARLEEPAAGVEESCSTLDAEHAALGATLDAALAAVAELRPLSEDLAKCQAVVGRVDELLDALAQ